MTSTMTVGEIREYILLRATETDIARIHDATKQRTRTLRDARASAVAIGSEVRIKDISPKALQGLTGTVTLIDGKHATVLLDEVSTATLRYSRTKHGAAVPHDATTYSMRGIPLSCCDIA